MPAPPPRTQNLSQIPTSSPVRPPQIQQPSSQQDACQAIFLAAIRTNRSLLPSNSSIDPIYSQSIDNIAHAMWQVAFNNEKTMNDVTAKASMFSQLKLRTLAKLNYLPSWWFMREMACGVMQRQSFNMDDREMQTLWKETVEWCARVEVRLGVQGENAAVKPGTAVQEEVGKVKS